MKLVTWNVNSLKVRLPHLLDWLAANPADIVCLQETKTQDADFPHEPLAAAGYRALVSGQRTYNGVAILTPLAQPPAELIGTDLPALADPQRRVLHARVGEVEVLNLYVPNGAEVGSEKYAYKLSWLAALQEYMRHGLADGARALRPLIVCGDFNIAPEDRDVHDPALWENSVLTVAEVRAALSAICALGLQDCFRLFPQAEKTYSWWDYRQLALRRNHGLRIDLILANAPAASGCTACSIDKAPRKLERPSDHAPVIAEFA